MLLLSGTALAQTVQIFEETPSIEQLRSIMIPESHGGAGRTIVIQHPDAIQKPSPVQLVNAQVPSTAAAQSFQPQTPAAAPSQAPIFPAQETAAEDRPAPPAPRLAARVAAPALQSKVAALAGEAAPAPRHVAAGAGIVGFRINFALDSAVLPLSAYPYIDRIGELMKEQPQVKLQIEGHTDALGSADYNLSLSKRRALAVAEYLVHRQGVDPDRLALVGKGMTEPMTDNPFDPRNRRVQFVRVE
jgi:outer membrane protein OmpA-like peptidoglycan-associated protein